MNKKIIIFGCGRTGYAALEFLGSENVAFFCDNNPKAAGRVKYGKEVLPFSNVKEKYSDAIVIAAAGDMDMFAMTEQCEKNGIRDYLFYGFPADAFLNREHFLHYIEKPENREKIRKEIYLRRIEELKGQVDYFKRHADIRYMKPATGAFRDRQLELVKTTAEFLDKIDELGIRPILYGGNLIGYVRHNGFIPWDDDLDFLLIRRDYERLKNYCRIHLYTKEEFFAKDLRREEKDVPEGMGDYYWYNQGYVLQIFKHREEGDDLWADFFSLDYYSEQYSFEELMEFAAQRRVEIATASSVEEGVDMIEESLARIKPYLAEESEHLYFGVDSMQLVVGWCYHRGRWIPKDVVYPLRKIRYENAEFWIPNDPEEFNKYVYEDMWKFPDDVGIPLHFMMYSEKEME